MYRQEKKYYTKAFFYALIMACILLLPFVIVDGGYFIFYGDYNAQQIPFYKTCIRAVQEGNFGWNWQTDLGVNFIGSYSFYTLGSPFFWFAALFPVSISQYLMAPLLALKLALSSLFAFIYIRRFVRKPDSALIGGILYAFSGFSMYNIFFNHFHEAMVFFPLLLIGLEEMVVNKRRGVFVLAVALNAFVNYYFFIGECIFLVIYFIVRMSCDSRFRISAGDFFCLAFESIVGVALAGALFVPSIFQVLDVPRATSIITDSEFLFYEKEQRYGLILEAMFFPPEIPARTVMFTGADAKWASVALYLPLFSMAGAVAFIKGRKKHWASVLMLVCLVMMFVPGLNSAFTLFNTSFSMRWLYMPELMICMATVNIFENGSDSDLRFGVKSTALVTGLIAVLVLLMPHELYDSELIIPRVLHFIDPSMIVQFVIAIISIIFIYLLLNERKKLKPAAFNKTCLALTIVCSMALGYYFVTYGRIIGPEIGEYNEIADLNVEIDDPEFYRMEAVYYENNTTMLLDGSGINSFISIVPASTFELYDLLDETRTVNSEPDKGMYALRSLTNVKYLIVPHIMLESNAESNIAALTVYEYLGSGENYDVYINDYALPMGYAYDNYVALEAAQAHEQVDKLMCRAVVLTDEQIERYSDILSPLSEAEAKITSLERFKQDAEERISAGVKDFSVSNSGFAANAAYAQDELVVFSVPYERGWSASVNGSPVSIEQVNGGFMAIRVPAGESSIVFTYETPGLLYGLMLTAGGAVLYGLYMLIQYAILRRKPRKYAHLYEMDITDGVIAHTSYISQLSRQINECPEKGRVYRPDVNEAEYEAVRRSLAESAAKAKTDKKPSAFHLNDGEEAYEILKAIEKKKGK